MLVAESLPSREWLTDMPWVPFLLRRKKLRLPLSLYSSPWASARLLRNRISCSALLMKKKLNSENFCEAETLLFTIESDIHVKNSGQRLKKKPWLPRFLSYAGIHCNKIYFSQLFNILHTAWNHSNLSFLRIFLIDQASSPASHVAVVHCISNIQNVSLLEV